MSTVDCCVYLLIWVGCILVMETMIGWVGSGSEARDGLWGVFEKYQVLLSLAQ